jgi:hypothetical protein
MSTLACARLSVAQSAPPPDPVAAVPKERVLMSSPKVGVQVPRTPPANATETDAGTDSKTQKSPNLVPRKWVCSNPMLGHSSSFAFTYGLEP